MRVIQVDAGREWRGGQNQVRLLARELVRRPDVEVRLATRRGSELARRATSGGVPVVGLPWLLGPDPVAAFFLARLIRAFRPAVINVHDAHALTVAWWARRWAGAPRHGRRPLLVATRHVDFHLHARSLWPGADCVIAVSEAVRRVLLSDGVPAAILRLIPEGVDPEEIRDAAARSPDIRRRLGLPVGVPLAVNVAALVDHKDQRTLVRAAAAARALRPDLHWAIAGQGELRGALELAIREAGIASHVHLLGYVDEADALIRDADVLVMSSKEEGLGTVVLNALALGTPVVATAAGGLVDVVPDAWRAPVGDAEALARRVVAAVTERPAATLPDRFTARTMAETVVALYNRLL